MKEVEKLLIYCCLTSPITRTALDFVPFLRVFYPDFHHLLMMFSSGKVGDWKNWFTVAQSEQFNAALDQEMRGTRAFELYSHSKLDQGAPDGNMNER